MKSRRVAITGLGVLSPCGQGKAAYWRALIEAKSHIRYMNPLPTENFPAKMAADIPDFDPLTYIKSKKSLKLMSREIQMAVVVSYLAIEDSAINLADIDRTRFGLSLGTGIINNDLDEVGMGIRSSLDAEGKFQMRKFGAEGMRAMYPLWFLKYLPNMPACHITIAHGLKGPSNTITTSSAAGAQAIGEAFRIIQRGDADLMLAGGTDSKVNAMGISRFYLLGLLSHQTGHPENAYRPFDRRHDGMVLGEGAGLMILEEWDHAKKRGARIYGEVVGYGSSSDFNHNPKSSEDYRGKRVAMLRALDDAGTGPEDVDFLLANGSGVPQEDTQEACAVHSVFENSLGNLAVTGVKPITGHLIYGAGGVEMAAAVMALSEGVVPPLANFQAPAPACDLPFVSGEPKIFNGDTALFNSCGFFGQNASIVLRKV